MQGNRTAGGWQYWLEHRGSALAGGLALVSMVARVAAFFSAGALNLPELLGKRGLLIFDGGTGIGLGVGSELLASIAYRARRTALREMREAAGRKGIPARERKALVKGYKAEARQHGVFALVGVGASVVGAFMFLATTSGSGGNPVGEVLLSVLLWAVAFYFGGVHELHGPDAGDVANAQALTLTGGIVSAAAGRLGKGGEPSRQDVRILAAAIRDKQTRERFAAAMMPDDADDPWWTSRDIAQWLNVVDDPSQRSQIGRILRNSTDPAIGLDPKTGAYRLPRSVAFRLFAPQFLTVLQGGRVSARGATGPRQRPEPVIRLTPWRPDMDKTGTVTGQPADGWAGVEVE